MKLNVNFVRKIIMAGPKWVWTSPNCFEKVKIDLDHLKTFRKAKFGNEKSFLVESNIIWPGLKQFWLVYRLLPKIWDWPKYQNRHNSKSIRVTKLSFCQSDFPTSESFWQKNSLITHIFFDQCLFKHFSPVANFGQQALKLKLSAQVQNYSGQKEGQDFIHFSRIQVDRYWVSAGSGIKKTGDYG